MKNRNTVYLASKSNNISIDVLGIIRDNHGENAVIRKVTSPLVLNTPFGFSNLLQQKRKTTNTNTTTVYVIQKDLGKYAFGAAVKTGIPFGILFKDKEGTWNSTVLQGEVNAKTRIR